MNDVIYDWSKDMPPEVRGALEPMLERYRRVWPRWLIRLGVAWKSTSERNAWAAIRTSYNNRDGQLWVFGDWLDLPADHRQQVILHEIGHMLLCPFDTQVSSVMENFIMQDGNEKSQPYKGLAEMVHNASEQTVSDLEYLLHNLLDGAPPAGDHDRHAEE